MTPPHPGNTHNIAQPNHIPDYSRMMAQSKATPSYIPLTPTHKVDGLNCSKQSCSGQVTIFAIPSAPPTYYALPIYPTPVPTPTLPVSTRHVYAQQNLHNQPTPNNQQG